ncbi:hypothetical protein SUDANB95_07918 (plasmid) [Actinosynnema sp. ALI-1.44]
MPSESLDQQFLIDAVNTALGARAPRTAEAVLADSEQARSGLAAHLAELSQRGINPAAAVLAAAIGAGLLDRDGNLVPAEEDRALVDSPAQWLAWRVRDFGHLARRGAVPEPDGGASPLEQAMQDEWSRDLLQSIENTARRSHPTDVPYAVAASVLLAVQERLYSIEGADQLRAQLSDIQEYLESLDGPAPLPMLPVFTQRRRDPRPRGDQRWIEVRVQLLMNLQEQAWREAAGQQPAGVTEIAHDVANHLTEWVNRDPVLRAAGARFIALPETDRLSGPSVEG